MNSLLTQLDFLEPCFYCVDFCCFPAVAESDIVSEPRRQLAVFRAFCMAGSEIDMLLLFKKHTFVFALLLFLGQR